MDEALSYAALLTDNATDLNAFGELEKLGTLAKENEKRSLESRRDLVKQTKGMIDEKLIF